MTEKARKAYEARTAQLLALDLAHSARKAEASEQSYSGHSTLWQGQGPTLANRYGVHEWRA